MRTTRNAHALVHFAGAITEEKDVLSDPNVFIGDTGASNHATNNKRGATNIKEGYGATTGITGSSIQSSMLFDLECVHCNKNGKEIMLITFTNVNHIAGGNYNLASLPRMMKSGWKMTGDSKCITMQTDQHVIRFDIVIPTKHGAVYAGYFKRVKGEKRTGISTVGKEGGEERKKVTMLI